MARIDWHIKGVAINACNCAWGCPCQFMSLPTEGACRAATAVHIERGHFGQTPLDGLNFGGIFAWPGPIHEGGGEAQPIVDVRADAAQREALLKIMAGEETEPGATYFNVFASTLARVHEPLFEPFTFELDIDARKGRFVIDGVVEALAEPIRNPITGEEVRARLELPEGFEFTQAEFASGTVRTGRSPIRNEWQGRHAHLNELDITGTGVVRKRAA